MIRIVAGKYKHRMLKQPEIETTRCTKDAAREGLFSSLGESIKGKIFLDLFSGSGAVGIEAYSRGASKVYLNDKNFGPIKIIKENLKSLEINDIKLTNLDYNIALEKYKNDGIKFDFIFLDPPYKMIIDYDFVKMIVDKEILSNNPIIILETDYEIDKKISEIYQVKKLKYGRSLMFIIKGIKNEENSNLSR